HYRLAGMRGTAKKPHDMQAAEARSSCHDLIDGRGKNSDYIKKELCLMHAEGAFRTQEIWRKEGQLRFNQRIKEKAEDNFAYTRR
ncbi:nuclease domain-containing protein, partial [Escherichia coli]|uniref:nuclease domain-containing protein n=1 Tax=Escherichia coli TaxID=562 RepID=UPI000C2B4E25